MLSNEPMRAFYHVYCEKRESRVHVLFNGCAARGVVALGYEFECEVEPSLGLDDGDCLAKTIFRSLKANQSAPRT